jgi:tetratricopeptide (TPR) repeat protein
MSQDDWYRNESWNDRIESNFFKKLDRARTQRDQYLAVQALTLASHDPKTTLRLVEIYFDTRTHESHDFQAFLARAEALEELGEFKSSVEAYKAGIAWNTEHPNIQPGFELQLAYLVGTRNLSSFYDLALTLLESMEETGTFPLETFKRHAAAALVYQDVGEEQLARSHAAKAVAAAEIRESGFQYHQDIGLVSEAHKSVVRRVRKLATNNVLHLQR